MSPSCKSQIPKSEYLSRLHDTICYVSILYNRRSSAKSKYSVLICETFNTKCSALNALSQLFLL